jgi:bifunctional non-homologous end joining protein LigD
MAKAKKKPITGKTRPPSPADIPGAVRAPLPSKLSPELATLASAVPARGDWIYEIKLDGYRIMTRFDNGNHALIKSRGQEYT